MICFIIWFADTLSLSGSSDSLCIGKGRKANAVNGRKDLLRVKWLKVAITHMDSRSSRKYSLVKADSVHLHRSLHNYACLAEIFMTNLIN